jgi:hypothetical protein
MYGPTSLTGPKSSNPYIQMPMTVAVTINNIGVQNVYTSTKDGVAAPRPVVGVGMLISKSMMEGQWGFQNDAPVGGSGVLCNSPFGKSVEVDLVNLTTNTTLTTNDADWRQRIENNPNHLVLKMLFLDEDEVPDR